MAPIATSAESQPATAYVKKGTSDYKEAGGGLHDYNADLEEQGEEKAQYQNYLPTWNPDEKYSPLELYKHIEHGIEADPKFPELLGDGVQTEDLTPTIGTEIFGLQLHLLSEAGRAELAAFAAQRKVLVFRNQGFADLAIEDALKYGKYFGRLHIHPTSGAPKEYPEVHLVHRGKDDRTRDNLLESRLSTIAWHADVTYEKQPPGTTFLYLLDKPGSGGDTLFVNTAEAYQRLSPAFRERLHGLKAVHSGIEQVEVARAKGSIVRREPVSNEHPVIRTHPITGEKAIFVNPQFTRYIVGYKKEESDALLKFLYDHIAYGADFQARVKWQEKTVVVWDNRVASHSATLDWNNGQRRHLARITPQAEEPYETPFEGVAK